MKMFSDQLLKGFALTNGKIVKLCTYREFVVKKNV